MIDYSSPNVAKRMHVGHLRSTVIGAALDQMHRYLGYEVIADNHIGDWGKQFGMLIVAWEQDGSEEAFSEDPIGELQRLYQGFAKASARTTPEAQEATAELQAGKPSCRALWRRFVDASLESSSRSISGWTSALTRPSARAPTMTPWVRWWRRPGQGDRSALPGRGDPSFEEEDGKGLSDSPC